MSAPAICKFCKEARATVDLEYQRATGTMPTTPACAKCANELIASLHPLTDGNVSMFRYERRRDDPPTMPSVQEAA